MTNLTVKTDVNHTTQSNLKLNSNDTIYDLSINSSTYLHNGRFATIDDVINHYSEGIVNSNTIDPLMKSIIQGSLKLTPLVKHI